MKSWLRYRDDIFIIVSEPYTHWYYFYKGLVERAKPFYELTLENHPCNEVTMLDVVIWLEKRTAWDEDLLQAV